MASSAGRPPPAPSLLNWVSAPQKKTQRKLSGSPLSPPHPSRKISALVPSDWRSGRYGTSQAGDWISVLMPISASQDWINSPIGMGSGEESLDTGLN